ncbi:expressed unknown protein [Seminavis robusta]|uniref:Uncharacterized protein n=1 Tax=Seminavis robusta TaxID=568900 RepID=A0A9N8DCP7_9STRA|nr:expressed unknown protein [Seminavis robusta]|eukprot:Sro35_g022490.1 n/a (656) ;mRNA; f:108271-110238
MVTTRSGKLSIGTPNSVKQKKKRQNNKKKKSPAKATTVNGNDENVLPNLRQVQPKRNDHDNALQKKKKSPPNSGTKTQVNRKMQGNTKNREVHSSPRPADSPGATGGSSKTTTETAGTPVRDVTLQDGKPEARSTMMAGKDGTPTSETKTTSTPEACTTKTTPTVGTADRNATVQDKTPEATVTTSKTTGKDNNSTPTRATKTTSKDSSPDHDDTLQDGKTDTSGTSDAPSKKRNRAEQPTAIVGKETTPVNKRRKTTFSDSVDAKDTAPKNDDAGYASDDTCRISNSTVKLAIKRSSSLCKAKNTGTTRGKKSVSFGPLPAQKASKKKDVTFSVGTPLKSTKRRTGTPHKLPKARGTSLFETTPGRKSSAVDPASIKVSATGSTTPQKKSSDATASRAKSYSGATATTFSFGTPQKTPVSKKSDASATTTPRGAKPYSGATAPKSPDVRTTFSFGTPQKTPVSTTTPRGATSFDPSTPRFKTPTRKPKGTGATPAKSPMSSATKAEQLQRLKILSGKIGHLQQKTESRKDQIKAKKLKQAELEEKMEVLRGDLNKLNTEQQDDRGKLAWYSRKKASIERQMAFESRSPFPSASKKRVIRMDSDGGDLDTLLANNKASVKKSKGVASLKDEGSNSSQTSRASDATVIPSNFTASF